MLKKRYVESLMADEKARLALRAKGIQDPRLVKHSNSVEQYDQIRHYDAMLAAETVKILNQDNIPLPASNVSKKPATKHWADTYYA